MACINDPKADGGCLSYLSTYNPYYQNGLWNPTDFLNPSDYECDGWVYIGRWVKANTFGQLQIYDSPVPDDTYTERNYSSGIGATVCTVSQIQNTIHAINIDEYTYGAPYDLNNNGGRWVDVTHFEYYDYYTLVDEEGFPDCPPGTIFNSLGGLCDPLPGYEEDPDNPGSWIPIYCISVEKTEEYIHTDGNTEYIYTGRTWTYRVYIEYGYTFEEDIIVYLSYAGSGITNGVEFYGPTSVIILAGESFVDFELTIFENENAYNKFLNIEGITELYDSCEIASNQILFKESTPVTEDSYCSNLFFWEKPGCADFFSSSSYYQFMIEDKG